GEAIWSARRLGSELENELTSWIQEDGNDHLRKHAAIALALIGNPLALPILRQIVREKDPFVPLTSKLYSQARGFAAIYLIGKLGDDSMISELIAIVSQPVQHKYISQDRSLV